MNVFDIIGPVMIGPSSSHTAGVVRIGKIASVVMGEEIREAVITFHSTFTGTYQGHGSDKAVIGGLLGFRQDDDRIRLSFDYAANAGLKYCIHTAFLGDVHPNTIMLELTGISGKKINLVGASTGGGNILITKLNQLDIEVACQYYSLIIQHKDKPGIISKVAGILGRNEINIAAMKVYRTFRGGDAVMVIETDQCVREEVIMTIRQLSDVIDVAGIAAIV